MGDYQHLGHTFAPVYDEQSKILILGTFPSVKSREQQFYYGHPQNRFWKLLEKLVSEEKNAESERAEFFDGGSMINKSMLPVTIEEKKQFLLTNHIAIWDVIAECDIIGSSDNSIKNVVPADLSQILDCADIKQIYANGGKAYELYQKYSLPQTGRSCIKLPSTSPANAAFQMERLAEAWRCILDGIRQEK